MTTTDELKSLLAEATNGPWKWGNLYDFEGQPDIKHMFQWCLTGVLIAEGKDGTPGGDDHDKANARLIAMAPDLAARVIELEAENARLRDDLDGARCVLTQIEDMEYINQLSGNMNFERAQKLARAALKGNSHD